ncbi:MAG TPA: flagellar hook-length control protein FliK, partial [Alphaproteobacteria bacterium]
PDTLGRVTVRLEFTSDAKVQVVFAAERPETLDLLKRDAREIARSLNEAGVRADAGSLSFSLHGNGNGGPDERQVPRGQPILFPTAAATPEPAAFARATYTRVGGVDIRI